MRKSGMPSKSSRIWNDPHEIRATNPSVVCWAHILRSVFFFSSLLYSVLSVLNMYFFGLFCQLYQIFMNRMISKMKKKTNNNRQMYISRSTKMLEQKKNSSKASYHLKQIWIPLCLLIVKSRYINILMRRGTHSSVAYLNTIAK